MDLFEVIQKRHSYRGSFKETPIPREDLRRIVQVGIQAPSGMNAQVIAFTIVDAEDAMRSIAAMHPNNKAMQEARAYICCIGDAVPQPVVHGMSFQDEDCAAAVENMLLAITALGYASVWVAGWLRINDNASHIASLLGIPPDKKILVILPVGVPAEERKQAPRRNFEERAWFNKYGE